MIDSLISSLEKENPEYYFASGIAENPIIKIMCRELNYNGYFFAKRLDEDVVTFDIERLEEVRDLLMDELNIRTKKGIYDEKIKNIS